MINLITKGIGHILMACIFSLKLIYMHLRRIYLHTDIPSPFRHSVFFMIVYIYITRIRGGLQGEREVECK